MKSHRIDIKNKVNSSSLILLLMAAEEERKEYDAPWLKNEETVFRDASGRFTSKKGGSSAGSSSEGDSSGEASSKEDRESEKASVSKEEIEAEAAIFEFARDVEQQIGDLTSEIPKLLSDLKEQSKNWMENAHTEDIKKSIEKSKRVIQNAIGDKSSILEIGDTLQEGGFILPEDVEGFKKGVENYWDKSKAAMQLSGANLAKFAIDSLENIQEGADKLLGGTNPNEDLKTALKDYKRELERDKAKGKAIGKAEQAKQVLRDEEKVMSDEESELFGRFISSFRGLSGTIMQISGISAFQSMFEAGRTSNGFKEAAVKALIGTASAEGANLGVQEIAKNLQGDLSEDEKKILGALTRTITAKMAVGSANSIQIKKKNNATRQAYDKHGEPNQKAQTLRDELKRLEKTFMTKIGFQSGVPSHIAIPAMESVDKMGGVPRLPDGTIDIPKFKKRLGRINLLLKNKGKQNPPPPKLSIRERLKNGFPLISKVDTDDTSYLERYRKLQEKLQEARKP